MAQSFTKYFKTQCTTQNARTNGRSVIRFAITHIKLLLDILHVSFPLFVNVTSFSSFVDSPSLLQLLSCLKTFRHIQKKLLLNHLVFCFVNHRLTFYMVNHQFKYLSNIPYRSFMSSYHFINVFEHLNWINYPLYNTFHMFVLSWSSFRPS